MSNLAGDLREREDRVVSEIFMKVCLRREPTSLPKSLGRINNMAERM